jgi:hypothetical protein
MPRAIKIEIVFDDGSVLSADESNSNTIYQWWLTAQTIAFIHGNDYKGPSLTKTNPRLEKSDS